MFGMFKQNGGAASAARVHEVADGLLQPESAVELISTPRRRRLIENIWQRTSLSRAQFALIYKEPIERYAALVQHFPASESHHHAYRGGMLDHTLEAMAFALKLRQSHLLPVGAPAESQAEQAEAWTAAIACASLLHDVGKIAVDLHVEYADGRCWHPWHGPLSLPYRFRYRKDRMYRLHEAAAGLLYRDILDTRILDWLSSYPELWANLLHALAGQYEHAGLLGELVKQADQASTSQQLGGDPDKARTAPKHALQRKLLDGLRYIVREVLKLNQPQASDGWLTSDALWLVAKTACDKLRAHLLSQGMDGIPDSNVAIFNVLQDHGLAQATPDNKVVWRATITSATGWSHSLTLLRLSPALIWDIGERPAPYAGSVRVDDHHAADASDTSHSEVAAKTSGERIDLIVPATISAKAADDVLASLHDTQATVSNGRSSSASTATTTSSLPHPNDNDVHPSQQTTTNVDNLPGIDFMTWLREAISTRRLRINEAKALVHTVDDTAFLVTPAVFQRYAQEHLEVSVKAKAEKLEGWQLAQKKFERLKLHKKQQNGLNIWTCEVTGPRKTRHLHGYLLNEPTTLFSEVPPNNPFLRLK